MRGQPGTAHAATENRDADAVRWSLQRLPERIIDSGGFNLNLSNGAWMRWVVILGGLLSAACGPTAEESQYDETTAPDADRNREGEPPRAIIWLHDLHVGTLRARVVYAHDVHALRGSVRSFARSDAPRHAAGKDVEVLELAADTVYAHDVHADLIDADEVRAHKLVFR